MLSLRQMLSKDSCWRLSAASADTMSMGCCVSGCLVISKLVSEALSACVPIESNSKLLSQSWITIPCHLQQGSCLDQDLWSPRCKTWQTKTFCTNCTHNKLQCKLAHHPESLDDTFVMAPSNFSWPVATAIKTFSKQLHYCCHTFSMTQQLLLPMPLR